MGAWTRSVQGGMELKIIFWKMWKILWTLTYINSTTKEIHRVGHKII